MPLLRVALLQNNSLVGELPPEWSDMRSIQAINVAFNQLTGAPSLAATPALSSEAVENRL